MFLQTMSYITEDSLIYSFTPKLSLSLFVTTVWTLEVSTCGSPFQASEGRRAQLMMILTVTSFLLLTMEVLATVCMNNFVFSHLNISFSWMNKFRYPFSTMIFNSGLNISFLFWASKQLWTCRASKALAVIINLFITM